MNYNYLVVDRFCHPIARTRTLHVAKILAHALSLEENAHDRIHILEHTIIGIGQAKLKGRGYYLDGEFYDFK